MKDVKVQEKSHENIVKETYPDAESDFILDHEGNMSIFISSMAVGDIISNFCHSEQSAWDSAFENLKQQGKL